MYFYQKLQLICTALNLLYVSQFYENPEKTNRNITNSMDMKVYYIRMLS